MKRLTRRNPLRGLRHKTGRRGETLIESVVSLLVFTMVLTTVSAIIRTALNFTLQADQSADVTQSEINGVNLDAFAADPSATKATITISVFRDSDDDGVEDAGEAFLTTPPTHVVIVHNDGEVFAFAPPVTPPPAP